MTDTELFVVIEHIEKILPQYKGEDLCKRLIRLEGERIDRFSEAHIEIIARAYAEAVRRVVVKAAQP